MKERFTRVLTGTIDCTMTPFPSGTVGRRIEMFARRNLWLAGLDYAHGTGHGVGQYLGVHEGPHSLKNIITNIQAPMKFEVFVSLSCHNCPDVVQAVNQFASINPVISAEMIDGGVYPELIESNGILMTGLCACVPSFTMLGPPRPRRGGSSGPNIVTGGTHGERVRERARRGYADLADREAFLRLGRGREGDSATSDGRVDGAV